MNESNQYGYAMTKPLPTGCIKQQKNVTSSKKFNMPLEIWVGLISVQQLDIYLLLTLILILKKQPPKNTYVQWLVYHHSF